MLMADGKTFEKRIENAYEACIADRNTANSRALSWEHCIAQFAPVFEDLNDGKIKYEKISDEKIDSLSLHLGFFLASWGMMRGSTDLLQYDYKVHIPAVKIIVKYHSLYGLDLDALCEQKAEFENFCKEIKASYKERKERPFNNVTNTLASKIIMGTFGITPAYDDFVTTAIREYNNRDENNKITVTFGVKSLQELSEHFSAHFKNEVDGLLRELQKADTSADSESKYYTRAKVIDMLLWNVGKEIAKEREEDKKRKKNIELKESNHAF